MAHFKVVFFYYYLLHKQNIRFAYLVWLVQGRHDIGRHAKVSITPEEPFPDVV